MEQFYKERSEMTPDRFKAFKEQYYKEKLDLSGKFWGSVKAVTQWYYWRELDFTAQYSEKELEFMAQYFKKGLELMEQYFKKELDLSEKTLDKVKAFKE